MVFSNLFQDRFVDQAWCSFAVSARQLGTPDMASQVQVVGYLHDRPALDDDSGGQPLFIQACPYLRVNFSEVPGLRGLQVTRLRLGAFPSGALKRGRVSSKASLPSFPEPGRLWSLEALLLLL